MRDDCGVDARQRRQSRQLLVNIWAGVHQQRAVRPFQQDRCSGAAQWVFAARLNALCARAPSVWDRVGSRCAEKP
jgi:hypothetical protein